MFDSVSDDGKLPANLEERITFPCSPLMVNAGCEHRILCNNDVKLHNRRPKP